MNTSDSAEEILELNVVDPDMGSGHFLVEAVRLMAEELIKHGANLDRFEKTPDDIARYEPADNNADTDLTAARRFVVERCIYGVDLNPLAVELGKLLLWLETAAHGRPLSFLDHHLRRGNSLIGAWTKDMHTPPRPNTPDEQPQVPLFDDEQFAQDAAQLVSGLQTLSRQASLSRRVVHRKAEKLEKLENEYRDPYREIGDLWCSRYFGNDYDPQHYHHLLKDLQRRNDITRADARDVRQTSREIARNDGWHFFHWEIEFPDVFFDTEGNRKQDAGFDVVVGNPPWERIKLQKNEFFPRRAPRIALAPRASERDALIDALADSNPDLWGEYQDAEQRPGYELQWVRESGQYPLMGRGDTNYYAVFLERTRQLVSDTGRAGPVVPSGLATDYTTREFFSDLVESKTLCTLTDFENRQGVFEDLDRRFKFTIIVFTGGQTQQQIDCGFFLHTEEDLHDPQRVFPLHPEDCELMNPHTRTCPVLQTRRDAQITRGIYERVPVLIRDTEDGSQNPWGVDYLRMFDMTNDSDLFRTADELESEGCYPVAPNRWRRGDRQYLPLYEGKMVQMYDYRAASVVVDTDNLYRPAQPDATSTDEHCDPDHVVTPRFWVSAEEVKDRLPRNARSWFLGFKEITSPTNRRTMIAAAIPYAAAGNKIPLLLSAEQPDACACILANLNTFAFDYVVRQKIGGQTLNLYIVEQLPVLPPHRYDDPFQDVAPGDFIAQRVLQLTYTAHDMADFAQDLGHTDETGEVRKPFEWDEERRLHLRSQLDALYFHIYGLDRDDTEFVMDTFPTVREEDIEQWGSYRTKELILHYWNAYEAGDMDAWVGG